MSYFFTADEHYYHENIIRYCNRPFKNVEQMNKELIRRHNLKVKDGDVVIHAGDFTMKNKEMADKIIKRLNGKHLFVKGSHDNWNKDLPYIIELKDVEPNIIVCHYAMRVWPRSHFGTVLVYGHSHGKLPGWPNSIDVGVDCWDYFPVSMGDIIAILKNEPKPNQNCI